MLRYTQMIFALVACLPSFASAAAITFNYTATLSGGPGILTGSFGYDDAVPDDLPGAPNEGRYPGAGFWTGVVTGGPQDGVSFSVSGAQTRIFDNFSTIGDMLEMTAAPTTFINMEDAQATTFTSDSLPSTLTLADFEIRNMFLSAADVGGPAGPQVQYILQSISPVPAPAAVWLFGSALGILGWTRRMQR
ncbi:MAG: hypothetical protein ACR2PS_00825 [Pseudomonadales bacterium]